MKFNLFQGIFPYCSKPHWPPRLVTTLALLPPSPGWLYYSDLFIEWDLFFLNHVMSRCHIFSISGSDVDHLCSGGGRFPNGAWEGRYFRLLLFISETCPSTWGSSRIGKPELLTVKGGLDKLSPVVGTPSWWSEFPSHLTISKLTFFSKMIMEGRCERKRKRSSVPHQLNPPVITAPSDGKDKRVPGTWFLSTPHSSSPALFVPGLLPFLAAPPSLLRIPLWFPSCFLQDLSSGPEAPSPSL